ncbi:GAF domain-containing protein [Candidatus Villigracilis affinis]|uniref:GAF domain-containing protein n=1 Tax=Candidatus Villigracilis affinis TaxID=3140682 RepID=UPI001D661A7E|nr:GAF domain-containing protein [Anaerolineales bacterium]
MQKSYLKEHEAIKLHILAEVSQQITSILDINELLVRVVRLIQQTFNYYHVGIGLIEGEDVIYRLGAGTLWDDPNFQFKPARLKIGSEGITGWVAQTGEAALVPDVSLDPHYVWMQGSLTKSELTVPITVKGRTIGVLDVQSQHIDDFEQTDQELMQAIASQTGIAMENARLFAETQRLLKETEQRANKLTVINSVQQGLASKLEVQAIYDLVGDKFRDIFDAQVVMISTYDPQSNSIMHRYAIERGERVYSPNPQPPGGFRSQIIHTRQPLLVNTKVAEEAVRLGQPTLPGTITPKSWLGVPMLVSGQVTGILSVQNVERENVFDESDIHLLQMFAASMSIALENARLYEQARQLAILEERQRLGRELHDLGHTIPVWD